MMMGGSARRNRYAAPARANPIPAPTAGKKSVDRARASASANPTQGTGVRERNAQVINVNYFFRSK
jgi:hypothetical protein